MKYDFHVIGIGLSAGGLTPLIEILKGIPRNFNGAFVALLHLPIDKISNLDKILSKSTHLNIVPVVTIEYVEPGNLYVLAEGKGLILNDRFLSIKQRDPGKKQNNTINDFFKSLANDARDLSIGVILSGAGSDGVEGAKAIEDQNGIVIVQEPETAQFSLMPTMLIANDHPDYILTPDDIAKKIIQKVSEVRSWILIKVLSV